jgi:C-terminal region of band_7
MWPSAGLSLMNRVALIATIVIAPAAAIGLTECDHSRSKLSGHIPAVAVALSDSDPHSSLIGLHREPQRCRSRRGVFPTCAPPRSEGARDAAINNAEGQKQQVIKASEANRQQRINEAQGSAEAILAIAKATAEGIRNVAESIRLPGGFEAVQLRVAEQYVAQFGALAKSTTSMILPASVSDVGAMIATAMNVIKAQQRP